MTESQLLKIITNGYRGDPGTGHGFDYVDYIDEINQRYWELTTKKVTDEHEKRIKQLEKMERIK